MNLIKTIDSNRTEKDEHSKERSLRQMMVELKKIEEQSV